MTERPKCQLHFKLLFTTFILGFITKTPTEKLQVLLTVKIRQFSQPEFLWFEKCLHNFPQLNS